MFLVFQRNTAPENLTSTGDYTIIGLEVAIVPDTVYDIMGEAYLKINGKTHFYT
jgi:hypothetical protein